MARVVAAPGLTRTHVTAAEAWLTPAGAWAGPADVPRAGGLVVRVPGTIGAALRDAGQLEPARDLDAEDAWFRVALPPGDAGRLVLHGVATGADLWIDGTPQPSMVSALRPHTLELPAGARELVLVCRALTTLLAGKRPRPRWKTRLVPNAAIRFVRTPLLGRMPGWSPGPAAVGPYRPIVVERGPRLEARVLATLRGDDGVVTLRLAGLGADAAAVARIAGVRAPLAWDGAAWTGEVVVPRAARWWPHTHGTPTRHAVAVETTAGELDLGAVGFRSITASYGPGLALAVNDVPVFARGAAWLPVDVLALGGDPAAVRAEVARFVAAGGNCLRLPGTGCYEGDAFHDACDELGVLVWQDALLANLDYPTDEAFAAELSAEVDALLDRLEASPSLAVLCGGSEVEQQAAMFGLPPGELAWPLLDAVIPAAARARRPDVPYVRNSPTGGALPFHVRAGVAHYFGVGAYQRPLDDARRSEVGFAAECLAFANPPDAGPLDVGVPRDGGAAWDFADVRDHYLRVLYGEDAAALRLAAPARYAALSRLVPGEVMAHAFGEWRRAGAPTAGALVWTWRDVLPGAGWGVLGSDGVAKAPYWYLRRAWAPLALVITDEGQDGLVVHAASDRAAAVDGTVTVRLLRDGAHVIADGAAPLRVAPRATTAVAVDALLGRFADAGYAYRFGPAEHDAVVATLEVDGVVVAEAVHFPLGRPARAPAGVVIDVAVEGAGDAWQARLTAPRLLHPVTLDAPGWARDDDYVTLVPGRARVIGLRRDGAGGAPIVTARVAL